MPAELVAVDQLLDDKRFFEPHGWNRARIRGLKGARIWCAWGVLSHNAVKIAALSN